MFRPSASLLFLSAFIFLPFLRAGELTFMVLPQARVEYEGTGYREVPSGWELKVKPWTPAGGIRWRTDFSSTLGFQVQYWMNRPAYAIEFGNSAGESSAQEGQMRLALQSLWVDLRRPLAGSPVEAVFGVNGLYQTIDQKDMVYHGKPEAGSSSETQTGLGAHIGIHAKGGRRPRGQGPALFWDGELLIGHYFVTHNTLTSEDGSIHQGGYTYNGRLEGGLAWPRWRLSLGYTRQMYEIFVPGGRRFTPGASESATASLPINKTDIFGTFLALGWTY
ncbi:MAG: hypothetical protein IPN90_05565 [Elusimicrobia bacterium]|nr:hypothetical protein [Elusimicrobiota bacterium]